MPGTFSGRRRHGENASQTNRKHGDVQATVASSLTTVISMKSMWNWIRNNLKVVIPGAIVGLGVLAFLAFGVFGVHTKFIDDKVSEDGPVFASGAIEVPAPVEDVPAEVPAPVEEVPVEEAPVEEAPVEEAPVEEAPVEEAPVEDVPVEAAPVEEPAVVPGEIVTLARGTFGERSHPGEGTAVVLNDGSEQRFLRFEDDFATDNGPDLFVYLTTADADAPADDFGVDGQFINLGRLSGNVGSQNYEIPVGLDLAEFDTVVVWCDRFSVAFTTADLA
ncbi:MAG: hypothetical protein ACI9CV_000145 [Ilumatobacter sp.]|jgi:hypothetical protein